MVRAPRSDVAGGIYHSLNRGNTRHLSFASRRTLKHLNVLLPRHLLVYQIYLSQIQCVICSGSRESTV